MCYVVVWIVFKYHVYFIYVVMLSCLCCLHCHVACTYIVFVIVFTVVGLFCYVVMFAFLCLRCRVAVVFSCYISEVIDVVVLQVFYMIVDCVYITTFIWLRAIVSFVYVVFFVFFFLCCVVFVYGIMLICLHPIVFLSYVAVFPIIGLMYDDTLRCIVAFVWRALFICVTLLF